MEENIAFYNAILSGFTKTQEHGWNVTSFKITSQKKKKIKLYPGQN